MGKDGMYGGILIDEMSIQEDLTIVKTGKSMKLVGNVDLGPTAESMRIIANENNEFCLAKYCLQFVFLSHFGFRWLVGNYPCNGAQAHELYITFWPLVVKLEELGFTTDYVSIDGAISNRQFVKMHFPDFNAEKNHYIVKNPIHPEDDSKSIIAIMDIKHNIKKIRNGIEKSDGTKKNLKINGKDVRWSHFVEAYKFDESKVFKTNRKLTDEHIFLNSISKMRNALAENVLSEDMLWLFEEMGKTEHEGTVQLLKYTSKLVKLANDYRPLSDSSDDRLNTIKELLDFFKSWESSSTDKKHALSYECREDIKSYLIGISQLFHKIEKRGGQACIIPARVNSDAVENVFCQQRAQRNGATTNPTYNQILHGTNAILLTATTVSKKSNSGGSSSAMPFCFYKKKKIQGIRV